MRNTVLVLFLTVLPLAGGSPAAANTDTTLPLHAIVAVFGECPIPAPSGPDPCAQGTLATNVATGNAVAVYLLARNYTDVAGIQTAFAVPATWVFTFGLWNCQGNQLSATEPQPPFGATGGTIATAFDIITGGTTATIGRMHFEPAGTGCITQVESNYPFGTHIVAADNSTVPVRALNRGEICAGEDGRDTCDPAAVPVDATTWGRIKSRYGGR